MREEGGGGGGGGGGLTQPSPAPHRSYPHATIPQPHIPAVRSLFW